MAKYRSELKKFVERFNGMCMTYHRDCTKCPLNKYEAYNCWSLAHDKPEEVERIVLKWMATRHEPRYPTWVEYLRENKMTWDDIMPEEIAKKLGEEPLEYV